MDIGGRLERRHRTIATYTRGLPWTPSSKIISIAGGLPWAPVRIISQA